MNKTTVEFIEQNSVTEMMLMPDAFKFNPKGRAQWLQRLAWKFLHKQGAMKQAYEPTIRIVRHTIDANKFLDRILKQNIALLEGFNKQGHTLLIGTEDYYKLMEELPIHQCLNFKSEFRNFDKVFGLNVKVIPWMRGILVMP